MDEKSVSMKRFDCGTLRAHAATAALIFGALNVMKVFARIARAGTSPRTSSTCNVTPTVG